MSARGLPLALTAALTASVAASAHHSPAAYDQATQSIVEGVLAEVSWRNPHVYVTVETAGPDGATIEQEIEAAAAASLNSLGVRPEDLVVGERVSVLVNPNRRGPGYEALGLAMTRPNGDVLAFRGGVEGGAPPSGPQTEEKASSIAGRWTPDPRTFVALSIAAQSWPLTDAGRAAAADLASRARAAADCTSFGPPAMMMAPGVTVIEIAEDRVTFDVDGMSAQREVHFGVDASAANVAPSANGYSIGRWEGETLVVETAAFAPDAEGLGFALPSSADKRVVERFTLDEDGRSLSYEATLEDPKYLTEILSMTSTWTYRPDLETSGMGCDLDSALRFQGAP
jgi:hypothetical protein